MPVATLPPTSLIASTNFTGAVTDVDEAVGAVPIYFDASTYLTRGGALTNLADGKIILASVFFRVAGGANAERRILSIKAGTSTRLTIALDTGNKLLMIARSSAAAGILQLNSTATFAVGAAWHHALVGLDLASSSNRGLYIDGVVDSTAAWAIYTNTDIDLAPSSTPGVLIGTYDGTLNWNGDLANLFFHAPAAYVDPSTVLSAFIDANGLPVNIGVDGSLPLGLQPILCMSRNWPNNDGSGGNFTVAAGTPAIGTAPVDV